MPDIPQRNFYSFDRVASEYEATRFLPAEIAREASRILTNDLPADAWMLDAGVGTGRFGRFVAEQHARTVGVDIALGMLQRMDTLPRPHRVQADLRALPFADHTFERVLSVHVFHLLRHWQTALSEIWRVLAPGGAFFLGREDRSPTAVREYYLKQAEAEGVLPQRMGSQSPQIIRTLEAWGATAEKWEPPSLQWERVLPISETLTMLRTRTYSLLWEIPEEKHRILMARTEEWARDEFDEDGVEIAQNRLIFYRISRPA